MNTKIYGLLLVLFIIYNIGFALECYMYLDVDSFNENTTLGKCNPLMAQETLLSHNYYYNVTNKSNSDSYDCLVVEINKDKDSKRMYGGCVYHGVNYCAFPLLDSKYNSTCKQCDKDECNGGEFGASPSHFGLILAATAATILSSRFL